MGRKFCFCIALLSCKVACLGVSENAHAVLIAHETLNYAAASTLNGQSGGTGWTGSWASNTQFTIAAPSLTYPSAYGPIGNRVTSPVDLGGNKDIRRNLAAALGADNTTTYFSFLIRPEGTVGEGFDNGTMGVIVSAGPITTNDLFIGKPGNAAAAPYAIENVGGAGQQSSAVVPISGEPVLLVVRGDFGAALDTFRLYVNPSSISGEPLLADATKSDLNMSSVSSLYIAGPGAFSVDEIRIGTTYADVVDFTLPPESLVVPEPGSLLLLSLGLLAVRRQRNALR